jgi:hypothetical protein
MGKRASVYGEIARALMKTDGSTEAAGAVLLAKLGPGIMHGLEALIAFEEADEENLIGAGC